MSTLSKRDSQWDNISVFKKVLVVKPDDNGFYPIGFSYLLGAWDEAGIQYDYVDMFLYPGYDIESLIKRNDYLVVCTGGLLGSFTFFQTLFERVKNVAPNLPCVLGGNITMDFPTGLLFAHTNVDYLVFGEGEITGTLLLSHIQQKGIAPTDLLGVAYRSPAELEGFVRNKRRPPLDLTAHNWQPTWDFLEVDRYAQRPHCTLRLFPILTGRGCKGRCSFCSPTNGQYRGRPLNYVFQEIESILGKYDFDYLHFLTEVFFQEETEVLEFCRRYKELGVQKPWACLQRIDSSPHVLTAMKDAGCFTINVGVESGCNRILKEMKKDITVDQIRTFIDLMKACNMGIEASFMVGNYSETESDITKTVDMMLELGIGGPKAMCVNYPGTLNFTRAQNRGLIKDVLQYAKGLRRAYSFDWLQHIEAHKSGELAYLNVTDMSDDTLFEVVIRELRRLHEFGYHIKNVGATPIRHEGVGDTGAPAAYQMEGDCPFCLAAISSTVYLDDIYSFTDTRCPHCQTYQQKTFFAPLDIPEIATAFAQHAPELEKAHRYALVGPDNAIRILLQRGYSGFDFSKIVGVIPLKEGNPCLASFIGNLPIVKVHELQKQGIDLLVSVATSVEGIQQSLGKSAVVEIENQGVRIVSLFPFGVSGLDIPVPALPTGKVLVVSAAQPHIVQGLLQDMRRIGCDKVSLLVQKPKETTLRSEITGEEHVFPGTVFKKSDMPRALIHSITSNRNSFAIFPYSQSIHNYNNVIECIFACGIHDIYAYHINNNTIDHNARMAYKLYYDAINQNIHQKHC